jgi:predicted acyl esterase
MISEQRLPGFSDLVVDRDMPAQMRDGTTLYADVYRPSSGGPFPVILMRLPYDKAQAESNVTYHHPSWYAQQGYMVVVQDTADDGARRGTSTPSPTRPRTATTRWSGPLLFPTPTAVWGCTVSPM